MKHNESKLQQEVVKWFRLQYPHLAMNLIAVPNGHKRSVITASILKREGVVAGCSDLILLHPSLSQKKWDAYNGLCIEMKYGKGKQTESQKAFQKAVEKQGYKYALVSDFDSFKNLIESYL